MKLKGSDFENAEFTIKIILVHTMYLVFIFLKSNVHLVFCCTIYNK